MPSIAESFAELPDRGFVDRARVVGPGNEPGTVRVLLLGGDEPCEVQAWEALPGHPRLAKGQGVLVVGESGREWFVVGVVGAHAAPDRRLSMSAGAYAEVSGAADRETLRVCSSRGELLFEYDPEANRTRVNVTSGDLELATGDGDILVRSSGALRLEGERIEVSGRRELLLGLLETVGQRISTFTMSRRGLKLEGPALDVSARKGRFQVDDARWIGRRWVGRIAEAQLTLGKLHRVAKTVVEKATNVYRTVENLQQLHVGRLRTLVDTTCHLKANKVMLKADQDVKVHADKIHLG